MKYKRFTINTCGAQICDKVVVSVAAHQNFFNTTRLQSNSNDIFTSVISEDRIVNGEPFMTGKWIVSQNQKAPNHATLQIQVAKVNLNVEIDSLILFKNEIMGLEVKNDVQTTLPLNARDLIRLRVLLYRLSRHGPIVQPNISIFFDCDGLEISIISSNDNYFQTMPAQLTVVSKSIRFTQQGQNNLDYGGESTSAFADTFQEFPSHKFQNKVSTSNTWPTF
jgi:hypothetical protein